MSNEENAREHSMNESIVICNVPLDPSDDWFDTHEHDERTNKQRLPICHGDMIPFSVTGNKPWTNRLCRGSF